MMQKRALAWLLVLIGAAPAIAYAAGSEAADAAQRKDAPALRTLVSKRANVNAPQPDGTTALHWAVHYNDAETAKLLLKAGASPSATNRFGASPLSEASLSGNAELLKLLLDAGADAKALATLDGETVLMSAARSGNIDSVRLLLDRGADVNAREALQGADRVDVGGRGASCACRQAAARARRRLEDPFGSIAKPGRRRLSAASSISPIPRGGFTALMFTAREGDLESARLMLDAGVDINHGDVDRVTPLVAAIMNKQYTLAKFLVERGADVNIVDAGGRTALYAAIDIRNEDWTAMPNRPLGGSAADARDREGDHRSRREARRAADAAADGSQRDGFRRHDTRRRGDADDARRARRRPCGDAAAAREGRQSETDDQGRHDRTDVRRRNRLSRQEHARQRKRCARGGQGVDGCRPRHQPDQHARRESLHGAALRGADTIAQFLLDKKMDVNATSKQGYTPLDVALGKTIVLQLPVPHESTVALLKKTGGKEGPGPRAAGPPLHRTMAGLPAAQSAKSPGSAHVDFAGVRPHQGGRLCFSSTAF